MPDQTALFPDLKKAAITILLNADVAGDRVYSSLPNDVGTTGRPYPVLVVHRIGGLPQNRIWLDRANLQLEAWGLNQESCWVVANTARKALFDAAGTTVGDAFITRAQVILGPQDFPDPPTGRDRVIFGVALFGHPIS